MTARVFTDPSSDAHAAPGHPERPERLAAALEGARAEGADLRIVAEAVEAADLLRVHTPEHLARVEAACARGAMLDADTYTTKGSWAAALRSAQCAVEAAQSAAAGVPALALSRPPGHHATRDRAMGFCLLNNVAVAAARLADGGRRVAIVDVDVHHGNGTQDIFYEDPRVLYVSLHQFPHYPMTGRVEEAGVSEGEGYTMNLPVPAGTGHDGWLRVFDRAVLPALAGFVPDVILVSLGFDAHHADPLASLRLTVETYAAAVTRMRNVSPNIAAVLEGGYGLAAIRDGTRNVVAALAGRPLVVRESAPLGMDPWPDLAARVHAVHGRRWCLSS